MDVERFWQLIAESRRGASSTSPDGNMDRQIARLTELLTTLPPQEVVDFDKHFSDCIIEAYNWNLWAAAYIIEGGCSDDGFMDFRSWLISMGQSAFTESLRDVESLVTYASDPTVEVCSFEEFQYVAGKVYGKQIDHGIKCPKDPTGEPWDEDSDDLATVISPAGQTFTWTSDGETGTVTVRPVGSTQYLNPTVPNTANGRGPFSNFHTGVRSPGGSVDVSFVF